MKLHVDATNVNIAGSNRTHFHFKCNQAVSNVTTATSPEYASNIFKNLGPNEEFESYNKVDDYH